MTGHIGQDLWPQPVLQPAAHGDSPGRALRLVEMFQDLPDPERNAFVRSAKQVAATMAEGEPGKDPASVRVEDGSAFACEIGQYGKPLATGGNRVRLGHQRVERRSARHLLQPADEASCR